MNRQEGVTVVLTTHYMDEADFLCNRVAIIDNGRIAALNTPKDLKDMSGFSLITNFLIFPLFFLSGAIFPLERFPSTIKMIAYIDHSPMGSTAFGTASSVRAPCRPSWTSLC